MKVAIIGGGITGLSAAYRLQTLRPDATVTLFERENWLGGKLWTETTGGFIVEGGADSFLSRKPRGVGLCRELGLEERLIGRDPRHNQTFVRYNGQLHPLPEGLSGLIPTRLDALEGSTLLSSAGKARLALEPEIPARADTADESIASFITRRLGAEMYTRLVEPLMSGIYAGDGAQLSLAATFPHLRQLEETHGSLLHGLAAVQPAAPAPHPPFVSFPAGMGELVAELTRRIGPAHIICGHTIEQLRAASGGFTLQLDDQTTHPAEAVILATPAHLTARLVENLDPVLAAAHAAIPYASAVTVNLAYHEADLPRPLSGYGYVIPRAEATEVLACSWSSNKWRGRAPANTRLLRVYLGRYGGGDMTALDDAELLQLATGELAQTIRLNARPLLTRIHRWPLAMPQYTLGHLDRVATIEARLAQHPGLFVAGAAYRGVGIPDCIASGELAAEEVSRNR